jgi:hypothetical protein
LLSIPAVMASRKPERGYNYHTLAKDLDGFLRALDLNDVTILGHSGRINHAVKAGATSSFKLSKRLIPQ